VTAKKAAPQWSGFIHKRPRPTMKKESDSTFLRWYNPDQVQGSRKSIFPSQPIQAPLVVSYLS